MKLSIKKSLKGLLVVPAIALTLGFAAAPAGASIVDDGAVGGADSAQGTGQGENLFEDGGIFRTITNVLLFLIGAVAVIMLIIGGIRYTVSGGDSTAVTSAKNTILYAVIGIVVALLAYAIVNFVLDSFVVTS